MMTFNDVIQYYLNHPPIEVTDPVAYQELLNFAVKITVQELSECDPIIEEKVIPPKEPPNPSDTHVLLDLYTDIDELFMEFIIFFPTSSLPSILSTLLYRCNYLVNNFSFTRCSSLQSIIAQKDALHVLEEWFSKEVKKIIFQGTKIKVKANTEYYCMYKRYRRLEEMPAYMMDPFIKLLPINLRLEFYRSNVMAGESEIKSVSISGLSVAFNVPSADTRETIVRQLEKEKNTILASIAIDYGDDTVGLVY